MFQRESDGGAKPWDVASKAIQQNFTAQFEELKSTFASKAEIEKVSSTQGEMQKEIESVKEEITKVSDNIAKILEKLWRMSSITIRYKLSLLYLNLL